MKTHTYSITVSLPHTASTLQFILSSWHPPINLIPEHCQGHAYSCVGRGTLVCVCQQSLAESIDNHKEHIRATLVMEQAQERAGCGVSIAGEENREEASG